MNHDFSKEELARYNRQIIMPGFSLNAQSKLKQSKVLVVGAGGLGSPVLLYLAAAGIGHIGIVDYDTVDSSNLQRQVLFTTEDIGRPKVEAARDHLKKLNPHIQIEIYHKRLDANNAMEIINSYDLVADGSDNFPTRYLVNDACIFAIKPLVYGSIFRYDGQLSVFNYKHADGSYGPNYRDLQPTPPPPGLVPDCSAGGVLGVLPGIIGALQAHEAIKIISGIGEPLSGKLMVFDGMEGSFKTIALEKDPDNPISGTNPVLKKLIDYDLFCGEKSASSDSPRIKILSVTEFKKWQDAGRDFQLVDVREPYEYSIANIGGTLIPLKEIEGRAAEMSLNKPVVFLCRSGIRSKMAIERLHAIERQGQFYNLEGGILAYADQIDPMLAKY
jgi:sulfur-carrier protein adenylyltransferase/sulfurtransferase